MKSLSTLILICFILSSCEKAINFNLQQSPTRLVVDGYIENDMTPFVVLSKSLNYFSNITPAILTGSFVHNAIVTISDGSTTHRLLEIESSSYGGDTVYVYEDVDAPLLQGEFGKTYSISIVVNGEQYTATTTIPTISKKIDSLWWEKSPNNKDSTAVILMARVTDPAGYGNYIRYFTAVNNQGFVPPLNSVSDDQITDGRTYNIQLENGVDRSQNILSNDYSLFHRGDTVKVKFCNIDKATYDFWRTMEYDYRTIGNPFSSPTTVIGNISNNGLGAFYSYAAQYVQIIIPK